MKFHHNLSFQLFFFIAFLLLLINFNSNNGNFASAQSSSYAASNITSLLEMKGLYTTIYTDSKLKLLDLERARNIKQSEINMIQSLYDTFNEERKVKADQQIKKAQKQLSSILFVSDELQFKVNTSVEAMARIDANITSILGGVNPSLNRFSIITGLGGDGLLVVKENSDIYGIGYNQFGNLGCGDSINPKTTACKTINTGVLKGKAVWQMKGEIHNVILTTDNTLVSFGFGDNGALGNGQLTSSSVPVLVTNTLFADKQIKQLLVGYGSSIITTTDGKMYGWGFNPYGELCFGTQKVSTPTLLPTFSKKVKKAFFQSYTSVYLTEEGEVYGCGRIVYSGLNMFNNVFSKMDISTLDPTDPVEDVAIAHAAVIFKTKLGNLYAVGYNGQGTLGVGDLVDRSLPTAISSLKSSGVVIAKVCAGVRHVVALSTTGKVYYWGTFVQMTCHTCESWCFATAGGYPTSLTPVRFIGNDIENYKIVDIQCGSASAIAISDTGVVFGWGKSPLFGSNAAASAPTKLTLP